MVARGARMARQVEAIAEEAYVSKGEFTILSTDPACSRNDARLDTYRKEGAGIRVVKTETRPIASVEWVLSGDPWQPGRVIYHYADLQKSRGN